MSVFIRLSHGRKDPKKHLDDWGEPGPTFGPFDWVHTTYAVRVSLGSRDEVSDLHIVEDALYYDGIWYGDWTVFDDAARIQDKPLSEPTKPIKESTFPPGTATVYRANDLYGTTVYPNTAFEVGSVEAETERRRLAAELAERMNIRLCVSCHSREGKPYGVRGRFGDAYCDECFKRVVRGYQRTGGLDV